MIETAIILAGGLGTRLRPLTNDTPKPLLPIKGKPILQHLIENLAQHGVKKVIISVGYKAEKIKEYFQNLDLGVELHYSIETEPLGTGGAVKEAAKQLTKPFILVWGDNLMDIDYHDMYTAYLRDAPQVTMALTPREDVENLFDESAISPNPVIDVEVDGLTPRSPIIEVVPVVEIPDFANMTKFSAVPKSTEDCARASPAERIITNENSVNIKKTVDNLCIIYYHDSHI